MAVEVCLTNQRIWTCPPDHSNNLRSFFFARKTVGDAEHFECSLTDVDGEPFDEVIPSSPITIVNYLTKLFSDLEYTILFSASSRRVGLNSV